MTALKEYMRLETTGLWRPTPDAQRREVGVAFGDATLVICDTAGRPLTHWSLPAVICLTPGTRPAIYSPDPEAAETLELDDDLMIGAIDRVRVSVARRTPRPGRVRQVSVAATVAFVLGIAVFWFPGALARQTLSVVPAAKRSEIGATLLGHVQRLTGVSCRDPDGTQSLAVLKIRLFGADSPGQIVVVPGALTSVLDLPGGIIVLGQNMIDDVSEPAVVAGYVLAAIAARQDPDPLAPVLDDAGFSSMIRLLTTGDIPTEALQAYVEALLAAPPVVPATDRILAVFGHASVPVSPWALTIDPSGETVLPMIEAESAATVPTEVILTDDAWVALQGICRT